MIRRPSGTPSVPFAAGVALGLSLLAAAVEAQEPVADEPPRVETVGSSDVAVDRRLDRLIEGGPILLTRDTTIEAGDTLPGSTLVLDATLILEGVVDGDLVIVDAGAFVRPGARVRGDLVNVAGGLYRSELARVSGTILDLPTAGYRVVRELGRIVIEASDSPSPLVLDDYYGFHPPTYDRVNGVTAVWGARYRLPHLGDLTPSVHGQAGWRTEPGEPTYGASARLRWLANVFEGGYEKAGATNDDWIRGDLRNSLSYLWSGRDYRDYHDVERAWAEIRREFGDEEKSFFAVLAVGGQVEDATTLPGGDPWHLWGDSARANPVIDDGRTSSALARFDLEWRGQTTEFEGGLVYEAARDWLDGDFDFDRVTARGEWAMLALANHTLEIEFFAQHPLGGDVLPRQRWSFVGGSGTLQTVPFAEYYGDRLAFVETAYVIPLPPRLAVPVLGAPDLELLHAAGMAWTEGEDRDLEQEVGARLQFFGLYFRFMMDPSDTQNNDLDISLSWPFGGGYPWEDR